MSDQTAQWWYENQGQPAGPISEGMLAGLIQSGQVRPTARVWRAGMAGWEPLGNVPELAAHVGAAPAVPAAQPSITAEATPPAPGPGPAEASPASPYAPPTESGNAPGSGFGARPQPAFGPAGPGSSASPPGYPQRAPGTVVFEEVSVGVVILLSIVTFGIYGIVKFFQTGKAYERLAGRESRFTTFFWLYVGLGVGSFFVRAVVGHLGWAFHIASIVFGILTLFEALAVRDEGLRRYQLAPPLVNVTSESTHKILYILGALLTIAVIGVVLLLVQAVKWFQDWNAITRGLGGRRL